MPNIYCFHAIDNTTSFLSVFSELDCSTYNTIKPTDESLNETLDTLQNLPPKSTIVFLGHGHTTGLYSPEGDFFRRRIFINAEIGNRIFNGHNILLLSCRSGEFITQITDCNNIVGFGNIISSINEVIHEAEFTGSFRELSEEDINAFNDFYVKAIMATLNLYVAGKISFKEIPKWISFKVNSEINSILKNKEQVNRLEVARLLFELRNEMVIKSNEIW